MTDVLISYARRDRSVASKLAANLAERGLKAVWDIAELPHGELLRAARQRLNAAPVVVVLWSNASILAPWVIEEANLAIGRDALVSASIDGATSPVASKYSSIDLADWAATGAQSGLDALIKAIAEAARRSGGSTPPEPETAAPQVAPPAEQAVAASAPQPAPAAPQNAVSVNVEPPPGETAATAAFIIIAFLALLGAAVARQKERVPANLPPVSMDATEPLEAPVIVPSPEEENAPSGLKPIPKPQDSTGSVKK